MASKLGDFDPHRSSINKEGLKAKTVALGAGQTLLQSCLGLPLGACHVTSLSFICTIGTNPWDALKMKCRVNLLLT